MGGAGYIDVIIDPPLSVDYDTHSFIILLICGIVSLVLIVAIIIVTVSLIVLRCQNPKRYGWSHLTEEQKVAQMKESGYVNPTYQYFDKVTQQN